MDISSKVLAWGISGSLAGGLALFGLQTLLIVPYLDRMEALTAQDKAAQVVYLFESEAATFARTADDWAYWNDTVTFVQGSNPTYERENLYPSAFEAIQVDSMVFFRPDRTVAWAKQLSEDGSRMEPLSHLTVYQRLLDEVGAQGRERGRQGFAAVSGGYDLVVIRPIQSEMAPGKTQGYLLMARRLQAGFWESFRARMGLAVVASRAEDRVGSLAPTVAASPDGTETTIRIPLQDLTGRVTLELTARQPRTLETTGMNLLRQITWGSVVILLLTTLGNLVFVRLVLVRPVRALWRLTLDLEATSDWSLRAPATALDEIGQLARGINGLIASVQDKTSQLESLAAQDALTGLANRRSFDGAVATAWRDCLRKGEPLGFIMADVDHFKRFNDRYGHRAGDVCLKMVAQVIQDSALRPGDVKARYGGEEFAVVLPATDTEGTRLVAERIRAQVELVGLPHEDNGPGRVTISLGAVSVVPEAEGTWEAMVEEADRRLYQAKTAGRNRVVAGPLGIPKG